MSRMNHGAEQPGSNPSERLSEERRERERAGTAGLSMMSGLLFLESTQDQKD